MRARPSRGTAVIAIAAACAGSYAGACVRIDPAPNGIASARLDPAPPSVAIGDSLRDSMGLATRVHGFAYDASGNVVATATFRYSYVPTVPDTTPGAVIDTALVVDSATGAVRATRTWIKPPTGTPSGRVLARIGANIQLADTIQIVPRANAITATEASYRLRYDCTDDRPLVVPEDTTGALSNTVGPFAIAVTGDSAGKTVPVRRWLVRWTVDTAPQPIPNVSLAAKVSVPAIAVISNTADAVLHYDTTDATTGTSNVRLRIRPTALGPAYSADTLFRVTLRADVIGAGGVLAGGSPARGVFTVVMSRSSVPVVPNVASCPRR